ncbi:hypothetical protein ASD04_07105 [Devosia sp. Root436]|uniref:hypothetical protein n=1 Tax=Devosia sp. Root436 TaxID=1736537 RepID=UPI0006F8A8A9|nr:hypothetical protein [Devosia sp. Root436]KQX40391.1 hypothetical protein ASD04_07105 [Devosia sp. Root436]
MKIQIAISASGDIHIWTGHHMPPAVNLVDVGLGRDGGMLVIPATRVGPLRELLGTGTVANQAGARDTSRIEKILKMAESLVDEIQAEVDGDLDDEPEFKI